MVCFVKKKVQNYPHCYAMMRSTSFLVGFLPPLYGLPETFDTQVRPNAHQQRFCDPESGRNGIEGSK
jgi:hypothetical protein